MSYFILTARLRRAVDYSMDVLEFIESVMLRDALREILRTLKTRLIKFSNQLEVQNNPLIKDKVSGEWEIVQKDFLARWQEFNTQENLQDVFLKLTEDQKIWISTIESAIKNSFASNPELTIEELREIAKQRLLEYELVELGETIKTQLPTPTKLPSCFISYAWGNKTHEEQVHQIAYLLKRAGIDVMLDIWCNKVNSIPAFTEWVQRTDFVMVVGTHLLKQKYDGAVTIGGGSWVHEELQQIGMRKQQKPTSHGIIKCLLEDPAKEAFPDFLSPLAHDYTDFSLSHHYYEKVFNLLELLYEPCPLNDVKQKIKTLREAFVQTSKIIDQSIQAQLSELLQLNNPEDYLKQTTEKQVVFDKIKQASHLFHQFAEREFENEMLYVKILKTRLQAKYAENDKIQRLFYTENPLPIASCYLHMALVQNQVVKQHKEKTLIESERQKFEQRDYLLHEYERIDHIQEKLKMNQMLEKCKTPIKRIYIEGAAGAGKSTLSQRIAYDWSQNKAPWNGYQWLFHIRLRDLRNVEKTKEDYLRTVLTNAFRLGDGELEKWQLEKIRKEMRINPRQVMFLLDGYDELQVDADTLKKLLEPLKDYDFIVTSRPGSNFKEDIAKHHIHIKELTQLAILGFSDQQVKQYIKQFFDLNHTPQAKSEEAQVCLASLQNNPNLWSLSHIPIQLELLCSIWGKELKDQTRLTLTSLYELMLDKLLMRLPMERQGQYEGDLYSHELREFYSKQIHYLNYLAYLGIRDNKIVFEKQSYIEKALKDLKITDAKNFFAEIKALGLFRRSDDGKQGEFLHLTFQEFLAANHWISLFESDATRNEASQTLIKNRDNPRYSVMWWFASGLLKDKMGLLELFFTNLLGRKALETLQQRLVTTHTDRLLLSMRCLEEVSGQSELATISQVDWLMSIYQQYLEKILLPVIRQEHSYISNVILNKYTRLITNLQISFFIMKKLDLNGFLKNQLEQGGRHVQGNILKILNNLNFPELAFMDDFIEKISIDLYCESRQKNRKAAYLLLGLERDNWAKIKISRENLNGEKWLIELGNHRIKALAVLMEDLSSEEFELRQKAAERLVGLDEYESEMGEYESEVDEYESEVDEYESEVDEYESEVDEYESEVDEYESEVYEYELEVRELIMAMWLEDLKSEKTEIRQAAVEGLIVLDEYHLYRPEVLKILVNDLKAEYARDRHSAAKKLIELNEYRTEALTALVENLNASNASDRQRAAMRLILLDEHRVEALAVLKENLSSEEAEVRQATAEKLIELDEHQLEALAVLVKDLNSEEAEIRQAAAERLIELDEHRAAALAVLVKDLNSEETESRQAAAERLIELDEYRTEALAVLVNNLKAEHASDRHSAAKQLIELDEYRTEALTVLVENLSASNMSDRQRAAIRLILLDEHRAEALEVLKNGLTSEKTEVRQHAAEWLIGLDEHEVEALETLVEDLNSEADEVRQGAEEQLIKLGEHEADLIAIWLKKLNLGRAEIRLDAAEKLMKLGKHKIAVKTMLSKELDSKNMRVRQRAMGFLIELDADSKELSSKTKEIDQTTAKIIIPVIANISSYNPTFHSAFSVNQSGDEIIAASSVTHEDQLTSSYSLQPVVSQSKDSIEEEQLPTAIASSLETLVPATTSSKTKKRNAPGVLPEIIQSRKKAKHADTSEPLALQEIFLTSANNQATSFSQASSSSSNVLLQPSFAEATRMESEQVELQQAEAPSLLDIKSTTSRATSISQSVPTTFFQASTSATLENEWQKQHQTNDAELQARAQLASPTQEEVFDDEEPISDQSFTDDEDKHILVSHSALSKPF